MKTKESKRPRLTPKMRECLRRLLLAQHQRVTQRMQAAEPEDAYLKKAMSEELDVVAECREWVG